MGAKVNALRWALTTKPSRPSRAWFLRNNPPRFWEDGDTVFVCGYLLAFLVALGWFYAVGWLGIFPFVLVWGWFIRAAHRLEQEEGML